MSINLQRHDSIDQSPEDQARDTWLKARSALAKATEAWEEVTIAGTKLMEAKLAWLQAAKQKFPIAEAKLLNAKHAWLNAVEKAVVLDLMAAEAKKTYYRAFDAAFL